LFAAITKRVRRLWPEGLNEKVLRWDTGTYVQIRRRKVNVSHYENRRFSMPCAKNSTFGTVAPTVAQLLTRMENWGDDLSYV